MGERSAGQIRHCFCRDGASDGRTEISDGKYIGYQKKDPGSR
jgi:hypothetical protein